MISRVIALALVAGVVAGCGTRSGPRAPHTTHVRPGDDLIARLARVKAGDRVVVHSGTYRTPGFVALVWRGTAAAPITVTGAPGERRPTIVGSARQNVMNLSGSYFTLARLELRGGSHGVRLGRVDHAHLDRLLVDRVGDVGISCNRPGQSCGSVAITRSVVERTGRHRGDPGEGLYLGCQDASCAFTGGRIEHNLIRDTGARGDGIELKPGSAGNVVRHNVICRTRHPGLNLWRAVPPNRVEHNLIAGARPRGILVHARARLRANRVFRSARQPGARACGRATPRPRRSGR